MHKMALLTALAGVAVLAGCIDPADYESAPVQVQTAQGVVTCQLYTERQVTWDRAISAPSGMSIQEANSACIAEGNRRLAQ